jgi:Na+/H+-dicarboxylate symporter
MKRKLPGLSFWIFVGLVLGVGAGYLAWNNVYGGIDTSKLSPVETKALARMAAKSAGYFQLLSDIFLRLIKVIVAPLVFSLLLVGLAKVGTFGAMGRIGLKTIVYFTFATLVSLTLGLVLVNLIEPGKELIVTAAATAPVAPKPFEAREFVKHVVPENIVDAMAHNEILPIIIFVLLFAAATAAIGQRGKIVVDFFDSISHIMLKVTGYVMVVSPFAVFGAVAGVVTMHGLAVLGGYTKFIVGFIGGLAIFIFGILWLICLVMKIDYLRLLKLIAQPISIAFGTASSEAAMPKTINALERFGCPDRIIGFVLPLGYSFNLDGSIMYMTFATVSIAQAYGIDLTIGQQITMMLMLLVSSKGVAGVPRASLVVIAAMLDSFHIPAEGLAAIIAVDWLLDMGRSATNVVGNAVATAVVSKWEGELTVPAEKAA